MQCPLTTLSLDTLIKSTGAWRPCPSYFFNKQRIWKSRGHVPPPSSINKRDRAIEALCVEFFLQASGRVETMAPAISIFSIREESGGHDSSCFFFLRKGYEHGDHPPFYFVFKPQRQESGGHAPFHFFFEQKRSGSRGNVFAFFLEVQEIGEQRSCFPPISSLNIRDKILETMPLLLLLCAKKIGEQRSCPFPVSSLSEGDRIVMTMCVAFFL